jgi:cell division protein FtsB
MVQNALRKEVNRLNEENDKLSKEVTVLEQEVQRINEKETELEQITQNKISIAIPSYNYVIQIVLHWMN